MDGFIILPLDALESNGFEHVKKNPPLGSAPTLEDAKKLAYSLGGGTVFPRKDGELEWKDMLTGVEPGTIAVKVWGLEPDVGAEDKKVKGNDLNEAQS